MDFVRIDLVNSLEKLEEIILVNESQRYFNKHLTKIYARNQLF
jgi:hypothetical protein